MITQSEASSGFIPSLNAGSKGKFELDASGVWHEGADGERMFICTPLYCEAETRDEDNNSWGRLLRWTDGEGHVHRYVMPVAMLAGDATAIRERLLSEGVFISTNRKARDLFNEYLQQSTGKKIRCCSKIGWYRDCFVLPDETFAPAGAEEVRYQEQ